MKTDICDPVLTEPSYWAPEAPEVIQTECECEALVPPEDARQCKSCGEVNCEECDNDYNGECRVCYQKEIH